MKLLRPQPLGIFPLPAGALMLPDVPGGAAFHESLLRGLVPAVTPPGLEFYTAALRGDTAAALAALDGQETPLARFNRFVMRPEPDSYPALRQDLPESLRPLAECVAYILGLTDAPPAAGDLDGELRAFVLSAQAAQAWEHNAPAALGLLEEAVTTAQPVSPALAAQLRAGLAEMRHALCGADADTIRHYRQAAEALEATALAASCAGVYLNLGICYQESAQGRRAALLEAARCYQAALKTYTRERDPEAFALAQNNLALCYVMMPLREAGDQLRAAIAIQSLREALKVWRRETHAEQWASAQLNLANMLQYAPTSHPAENLAEAVRIYEELLDLRRPAADPLGYARLLANQGNALAHLGIFAHAETKLRAAQELFTTHGEAAAAESVRELLAGIAAQRSVAPPAETAAGAV